MLKNIKVLDLTIYLAGPYCTWVLAALGAQVTKIERPEGGDPSRGLGPFINDESIYFASVNRNKRSLALDLKTAKGRDILEKLIKDADILVENLRPGVRLAMGLTEQRLQELNPRLIALSISGFGATSPYGDRPAFDIIAQAMSGMMHMTGQSDGPPNLTGASIGDIAAGLFGAISVLARLHNRDNSNQQSARNVQSVIDVSMTDCQMALLENAIARTCNSDAPVGPIGTRHAASAPFQLFNTADRPIVIAVVGDVIWQRFCDMLGDHGNRLSTDTRFSNVNLRNANVEALSSNLESIFTTRTRDAWLDDLQAANIPAAPVNSISEALNSPHTKARNLIKSVTSQAGNSFDLIDLPFGQDQLQSVAAPALGQHTSSVLRDAGFSHNEISALRADGIIS